MYWWEEEQLLTERDKAAIEKAREQYWADIDENAAETELGKRWLREISSTKYHMEEYLAGMD